MIDLDKIDINKLLSDRKAFDQFVYTPANEAIIELKRRWNDSSIINNISIPDEIRDGFRAVLYVSVITPNQQIIRYIELAKELGIEPLVFEQRKDKFTSNNEWKHSLGKLRFSHGKSKNGKSIIEYMNVIDFNAWNGKMIPTIKTLWGQDLISFHHELFLRAFPHLSIEKNVFDGSDWFSEHGSKPREYYKSFLSLLIKHGIQFENFMLNEKESFFTREIFLPAFIDVYRATGLKPLIIALEPTETEGDEYWISYSLTEKEFVINKIGKAK